ncbi:MAG: leucine--tRNA ligase [Armatimonadetes bacterium]|nr:leucine--tRNA ligase [Armatimonadota bacterium]
MTDTAIHPAPERSEPRTDRDDRYPFARVEAAWRQQWAERRTYATDRAEGRGEPFYALEMFPYPSGDLHWGHVRNYTIGDVAARYQVMKGRQVLHPMGWDAFGLPAENAAIQNNVHPAEWTQRNIARMRDQFSRMAFSYDWSKEINTASPEYYRWTQWIFLQLYNAGLAYKKNAAVNWCPSCETALANEQVVAGACERCETPVTKKMLSQWYFAITKYADRLLDGHAALDWPEDIITMQKNWIGRSTGAEVRFRLDGSDEDIPVFTTRPDTLFGVTYMVLAPEHPLVDQLVKGKPQAKQVAEFRERLARQTEIERTSTEAPKEGIELDAYAINPVNNQAVPIWIANYVLLEYGTGAVMAVPAHDQRDYEFAQQYGLPILDVIQPPQDTSEDPTGQGRRNIEAIDAMEAAYIGPGTMVNSGEFTGMPSEEFKRVIAEWLEERGKGRATVNYRLRDWLLSRQRYWGAPIPILYCPSCGEVPVPEDQLPVELPTDIEFTGKGESPLASSPTFTTAPCPKCNGTAKRDTDTMDTFVDSSWYFLRYPNANDSGEPWTRRAVNKWLPVDQYIGGREHATMHLIYARFLTMALHDLELVSIEEPFQKLFNQGIIYKGGKKLSKRHNAIPPDATCDRYGVDTARIHVLFLAPPAESAEWSEETIEGTWRFLNRIWRHVNATAHRYAPDWESKVNDAASDADKSVRRKVHQTVQRVTEDMERLHYNTSISAMMEMVNELYQNGEKCSDAAWSEAADRLIRMLAPFAPYMGEELWAKLGHEEEVYFAAWPSFDPALTVADEIEVVFQVNGKVRDRAQVPADISREALEALARENEKVKAGLGDLSVKKVIVVPGKLVNLVVGK